MQPARTSSIAIAALLAACGGDGIVTFTPSDATTYVVRQLRFPTNNAEARAFGQDLDGNGTIDNQLGMVMGALTSMGFTFQADIDASFAEGRVILLVRTQDLTENGGASSFGSVQVLFGANPQPPACDPGESYCDAAGVCGGCQHHLTGSAHFDVDPSSPDDPVLVGARTAGTLAAGPGALSLEFVNGGFPPVRFDLIGARARVSLDGSGEILLGGALTLAQVDDQLVPLVQQVATKLVERDCCGAPTSPLPTCPSDPRCGCPDGSQGKTVINLFDVNHDCMVSDVEVETNSLFESLLAPDITIDGQQVLSVGLQTFVVGATF